MDANSISHRVELDLYGKVRFQAIDFDFKRTKELLLIKGANGVGKSTLLKTLAGLYSPLGRDQSPKNLKTSYCGASGRGMLHNLTGAENLKLYFRYQGMRELPNICDFFDHPNYHHALSTPFKDCSSGMRKMLLLAYTLMLKADLYLLDEPMTHLDLEASEMVCNIIEQLLGSCCIIAVDHSRRLEERFSPRILDIESFRC